MHDIKTIFEDSFKEKMKSRNVIVDYETIQNLDSKNRQLKTKMQELQSARNTASDTIGKIRSKGGDITEASDNVRLINEEIEILKKSQGEIELLLEQQLSVIPNTPLDTVPIGNDETGNELVLATKGMDVDCKEPKNHWDLQNNLLDFDSGVKVAGSRFTVLKGKLATLHRAIAQFMINNNINHGYTEINIPVITNSDSLFGTGQLPKFADDLFRLTNDQYLIPTSEVSLTNLHRGEIINNFTNPLRYTALSSCFRSEAGGAGKDTRGMIRQHQFEKCELVSICTEEQWQNEFDLMVGCSTNILKELNIPFRIMKLCTGDMGFSARMTYDIEVWLPGQNCYREISSISYCGDFQARRMNLRYKKDKKNIFLNTLNGSSLAVGRTLVAIMENYQQDNGNIIVPDVLQKYTGFNVIENF